MTSIYRDIIPSILPTDEILVEEEAHEYVSQERPDGSVFTQQSYQLEKAPFDEVKRVEGEVNGSEYDFVAGEDYEVDDDEFVNFGVGGKSPDTGTEFYVTYTARSILDRYIEGHEEEINTVDEKRQRSIDDRFVDRATGTELEEIGSLFGSLGERRGRDDNEYRLYLKSLVQSFSGRGRKDDLKFAVASAFGSGSASFRIEENFEEVEYTIELDDWPPHKVGTLVELLELADPSGVELRKISYNLDTERVGVEEIIETSISEILEQDDVGSDDVIEISPNLLKLLEEVVGKDTVDINKDRFTEIDTTGVKDTGIANRIAVNNILEADDVLDIDSGLTETVDITDISDPVAIPRRATTDTTDISDPVASPRASVDEETSSGEELDVQPSKKNKHRWEDDKSSDRTAWNFFEWTELIELTRNIGDGVSFSDSAVSPPTDAVVSEEFFVSDAASVPKTDATVSDTFFVDDNAAGRNTSTLEELSLGDVTKVNFNSESFTDTTVTDDEAGVAQKGSTASDNSGSSDTVTDVSSTLVAWDTQDWGTLNWVQEHN